MSKKVVVLLSVLAIVLAGVAGGLWFTVKDKTEQAMSSLGKLTPEFGGATFESRLGAPAKAVAQLAKVRGESTAKSEEISSKEAKISGLERKLKDSETSVAELETKTSDLTRSRDELKSKSEVYQASVAKAESRVKELEENLVKQTEVAAKEKEELNAKINSDKSGLISEVEKTRQAYSQLYNFTTAKGLKAPLSARPWDAVSGTDTGPRFATNVFVAEIVGFDARQGLVVLNVGSEAGLIRSQGFNVVVGDTVVAKVTISEIINGAVSTATFSPGSPTPKLTVGTAVKLVPLNIAIEPAPATPAVAAK